MPALNSGQRDAGGIFRAITQRLSRSFSGKPHSEERLVMETISAYQLEWAKLRKRLMEWYKMDFAQQLVSDTLR
jgi:hypothetical protein